MSEEEKKETKKYCKACGTLLTDDNLELDCEQCGTGICSECEIDGCCDECIPDECSYCGTILDDSNDGGRCRVCGTEVCDNCNCADISDLKKGLGEYICESCSTERFCPSCEHSLGESEVVLNCGGCGKSICPRCNKGTLEKPICPKCDADGYA